MSMKEEQKFNFKAEQYLALHWNDLKKCWMKYSYFCPYMVPGTPNFSLEREGLGGLERRGGGVYKK